MSRLNKNVKALFKPLGTPGTCYYCNQDNSSLHDTTPSHRASKGDADAFNGDRTITNVCQTCWGKIHRFNWVEAGRRFGVAQGCMTIAQKASVCGGIGAPLNRGTYVLAFDGKFVIHHEMIRDAEDSDVFYHGGNRWDILELKIMQPLFAMRFAGLHTDLIKDSFWNQILQADDINTMALDRNDVVKYQKALGIEDVPAE